MAITQAKTFSISGDESSNNVGSLALCKEALRVDHDEEDHFINVCRASAKALIEGLIHRSLDNVNYEVVFDFPTGKPKKYDEFWLPVAPLLPAGDITIKDIGTLQAKTRDYLNYFITGKDLTEVEPFELDYFIGYSPTEIVSEAGIRDHLIAIGPDGVAMLPEIPDSFPERLTLGFAPNQYTIPAAWGVILSPILDPEINSVWEVRDGVLGRNWIDRWGPSGQIQIDAKTFRLRQTNNLADFLQGLAGTAAPLAYSSEIGRTWKIGPLHGELSTETINFSKPVAMQVRTFWEFGEGGRNKDIVAAFLSLVAEQYRKREVYSAPGQVSSIIKQSLYKYVRRF